MEIENLNYPDAIIHLAGLFNIAVEIDESKLGKQTADLKSQLIQIHAIATEYYQKNLYKDQEEYIILLHEGYY